MRRGTTAIALAGALVVTTGGGWALGQRVESPAAAAARTAPPRASRITVEVQRRALASSVVTRGSVNYDDPTPVSLAGAVGGPAAASGSQVVTVAPQKGREVTEGSVLAEVSGRPVLVLQGPLPTYRALTPGSEGGDVRQLEEALARLGFDPGPIDGRFDAATQQAVVAWYGARGYAAQGRTTEQEDRHAALEAARDQAESAVSAAQRRLASAARGPDDVARLQAEIALRSARDALAAARAAAAGNAATPGGAPGSPPGAAGGPATERQAADQVALAEAQLAALLAPPDTGAEQEAVTAAQQALARAQDDLDRSNATTGVGVPAGELVFVPSLPARVDTVEVHAGQAPTGKLATLTSATLTVKTQIALADRPLLKEAMAVKVRSSELGIETAGTIKAIATSAGTDGLDDQHVRVSINLDPATVAQLAGASVRIDIPVRSTGGAEVLAVPHAAVSTGADGRARVEVESADRTTTRLVTVTVGLVAEGLVEITPGPGEVLQAGDRVVVGASDATTDTPAKGAATTASTPKDAR